MRDVYERHATDGGPRSYRLTANICPFLLAKRNQFHAIRSGPCAAKMSHRPTI